MFHYSIPKPVAVQVFLAISEPELESVSVSVCVEQPIYDKFVVRIFLSEFVADS